MSRIFRLLILFSPLLFSGCGEAVSPDESAVPLSLDFNLVVIDNVSEPSETGMRTIELNFSDKNGNALTMNAISGYRHLEAGWYDVVSEAYGRQDAEIILSIDGNPVQVSGGTVSVTKKDYEYDIKFTLATENGKVTALADRKKIYFENEQYSSLSSGADGNFRKDLTFKSEILNSVMKYSIYLPEGYDKGKEYPILYILHGMDGNNNDWLKDNSGSLWSGGGTLPAYAEEYAELTGKELIIVSPEGRNLFYCDGYEHGMNYMSYFFEEFLPFIESEYPVRSERSSRAIGGLSMGGFGSLYYGLLHPELFCHVYACSAAVSVGGNAPDLIGFLSDASARNAIGSLPGLTLEIGTEDFLFSNNEAFIRTLDSYNVPYEYITRSGAHDWKFWNACSPKIIRKVMTVFE